MLRTTQTEAFQDQWIPDEKSLGFSCTVGSAHHSTSIHGHITNLMQFFILLQASGLWLSTKAIKFKAVRGSDGCIWLRGRRRRVPATFTTEMCQQHYPVFTSRLFTHRDGRCSLALQDERFVTFLSAQHISKAAVERSHQSSWWKYEVPRCIWHISGGEADCWCWRVASAHRKKTHTSLCLWTQLTISNFWALTVSGSA